MSGIYGVILAGGTGTRMNNTEKPKQFLDLGGAPILIHTAEKFLAEPSFREILILVPKAWNSYTQDIIRKYLPEAEKIRVLNGGSSRNETIMNAISYIEEAGELSEDTIIVTHDSVRPFVTRRILRENIRGAVEYGATDTVVPATDTIVRSTDSDTIEEIPERKFLYQGQTPQSFHALQLKNLYEELRPEEKEILTDACKILVLKGQQVKLVRGEQSNIKITYPYDMTVARALLGLETEGEETC